MPSCIRSIWAIPAAVGVLYVSSTPDLPRAAAFQQVQPFPLVTRNSLKSSGRHRCRQSRVNNWISDLWSEIIEFSTYGPGERAILAERRKAAAAASKTDQKISSIDDNDLSLSAFQAAKANINETGTGTTQSEGPDLSPSAFRAAVASSGSSSASPNDGESDTFDGYALRDLLVSKWGASLDVDFQRDVALSCVYCTVLPVAFGQKSKCRHESELDYLMHLQGIIEVLRQYDNLDSFVRFLETTSKAPKSGTDSVPYRMLLTDEQLRKIL